MERFLQKDKVLQKIVELLTILLPDFYKLSKTIALIQLK